MNKKFTLALRRLAVALTLSASPLAHACSPVKSIGVYFERESSTVSAFQVSRLAGWMADLHARYPNFESIYISTGAEPDEHAPDRLGMARARNVARVLRENLGFAESKLFLPSRSHVQEPVSDYLKTLDKSQGVRGVQMDFVPGCPHECPCQMNDPLYKPGGAR